MMLMHLQPVHSGFMVLHNSFYLLLQPLSASVPHTGIKISYQGHWDE